MQLIATDNKQVVIGLGLTGLSCARYLKREKRVFSVVDSREEPPELENFRHEFPDVEVTVGEISDESLLGAALLIVSPGVALDEPAIANALKNGTSVCGDIDLFREKAVAPIVAITGSNGKSTVTTLLGEMAKCAGKKAAVGGNIGVPALDLLEGEEPDLYVLELSSFQLERAGMLNVDVATVLNISADHMDRYPNLIAYHQAKHQIFRGCKKVVVNRADPLSRPLVAEDVEELNFGLDQPDFKGFGLLVEAGEEYLAYQFEKLMPVSELKIVGRHNIENALAALALGKAVGLSIAPMLDALRAFRGLEHRCQLVDEWQGVRYYNDSKGTNVGASIAAIEGLVGGGRKVVLIAGGVAKGADFSPLLPVIKAHVRGVVVIGEAAEQLTQLCSEDVTVVSAMSMDSAVKSASLISEQGDAVLLSPACASFDMFKNYQHRGESFVNAVADMTKSRGG